MEWDKIKPELRKKLDPKHIKPPPQGKYGEYVDGYHVVSEANRIFGEDGWSYEITDMRQVSRVEAKDRNGNDQIRVGYYCAVKVYVNGASFKHGAAVGTGIAKPENEADAHESAVKEAETDALKRALRTYGNTFGLALYDRDRANVGTERDPKAVAQSLIGLMEKAANIETVNKALGSPKFDEAWAWLDEHYPDEGVSVRRAVDNARNKFSQKEAAE